MRKRAKSWILSRKETLQVAVSLSFADMKILNFFYFFSFRYIDDDHTEAEKKSLHGNYLQYLARVNRLEEIIDEQKRKKKEEKKTKKKKPLFKLYVYI